MKRNYSFYYQRFQTWSNQSQVRASGLATLSFFTVAFFLVLAILPTFKTIAGLRKEIEDSQNINAQLAKKIQALKTAEVNYSQNLNKLELVNRVLPEKEEFERLAWQTQWLAKNHNLELINGSFGEFNLIGQEPEGLKTIPIELTINGNYLQIKNWINSMVKIDRLITVESLNLTSKGVKSGGKVNANIKFSAYYLPEEPTK